MPSNRIIDIKKTETGSDPVTLAQAKSHLIITFTDDDTLITSLITQCRQAIEEYCAISIVQKTIVFIADLFKEWELPYGPVIGIQSVQTRTGTEGSGPATYETQTSGWEQEGYEFMTFIPSPNPGLNPRSPFTGHFQWGPDASTNACGNRYKITYIAGYSTVPEALKLAILNEIAYRYELKGADKEFIGICNSARVIAGPYKRELWF